MQAVEWYRCMWGSTRECILIHTQIIMHADMCIYTYIHAIEQVIMFLRSSSIRADQSLCRWIARPQGNVASMHVQKSCRMVCVVQYISVRVCDIVTIAWIWIRTCIKSRFDWDDTAPVIFSNGLTTRSIHCSCSPSFIFCQSCSLCLSSCFSCFISLPSFISFRTLSSSASTSLSLMACL